MFKKYKFPLNIFMIFDKINPVIYTSQCLTDNHYVMLLPSEWYFSFMKVIRNEVTLNSSTLIEQTAIDTKNFSSLNNNFFINTNKNNLFLNIFYFYLLKIRLTTILYVNNNSKIHSLDKIYENSNWLERETSEMFNINFIEKRDIRNLLLEYSKNEYPMLKDFPCEGYYDLYYDIFQDQLQYIESEFVEL